MISMIMRRLMALAAFGMVAMPATAQVDPAARGLAVQAQQQTATLAREASMQGASLTKWRACRSKIRVAALATCKMAIVGDSKSFGAGAGTGAKFTINAFGSSRPSRLAALLGQQGLATRTNSWFGAGGMATLADVLAYDPRRTGFSAWSGGSVSLGGAALATGNTNPGNFQPSVAVDRASIFFVQTPSQGQFTVSKGSETFTLNAANATNAIIRSEITFTTKDASPIVITRTAGGFVNIVGMIAWDSATPGIEVSNFSVYGVVSGYQADVSNPWSPLNALGYYAPDLTIINLWTNNLNTSVPLATSVADVQAIITRAKLTGDCILEWPSIAGTAPAYGSDAVRAQWRASLVTLASTNGCAFVDDEALLGGRAGAVANGATADGVHEAGWAYDVEAQTLLRYLLQ
ncbi:SGNH/GDSL hydrolase family protein [Sphingomonas sp. PP-CE-1G-424]|uniref:SGNH/GDSL hydrolase family protein n=1 Tax=Sphingomonas sp. PP-CE-1G-424 TaxID=2135658 RepID=UPI0010549473|nr:SGNH/GDSL hydrolase family protein [Sphingomonas sp. PP-CE-1G-424]TCP65680.1 hypothetical protein C8J43_1093 [Sphingomonas sp. PP-CE-1G-424]